MARRPAELAHLARRLFTVVRGGDADPADHAWAQDRLPPALAALWAAQDPTDRRHSVAVARAVLRQADADGSTPPPWVVPAALLHDVGKTGTGGIAVRVSAGVLELVGVRSAPGAVGRYLAYPARGADRLRDAGAAREVVAWAAQHHEAPSTWTVPMPWGRRLAQADRTAS